MPDFYFYLLLGTSKTLQIDVFVWKARMFLEKQTATLRLTTEGRERLLLVVSSLDPCVLGNTFGLVFSCSHDDVIGKITLSKDTIGSQTKGEAAGP